ncbi:unnamed protein product [Parnassius apollo]|uniref:(apollo) hypothetical protein n=1 Tax=Parnassius apollo TaxID=110799 RepID=A0A8S3WPS9_PARAO|nr:unnamed protein product [Parnassius apollo]
MEVPILILTLAFHRRRRKVAQPARREACLRASEASAGSILQRAQAGTRATILPHSTELQSRRAPRVPSCLRRPTRPLRFASLSRFYALMENAPLRHVTRSDYEIA